MSRVFRGAAVAALLAAAPRLGFGQQTPTAWPKPGQLIDEGIALHDKEDYPGAIAKYQAVSPGDSSYATAQSELALSLEAANKHEEAVAAARRALALHPFEPHTYNTLANAQEELKQIDAALVTYGQGLKLYPYNQNLIYNQAVLHFRQDHIAEALAGFQRSLELNPTHPNSHRLLGALAAEQQQPTHALISWLAYLAVSENGPGSHDVLVLAERLSEGAPVVEEKDKVKPVSPNDAFAELDQLIESKVALQPGYASKVKFNAAVVKQTQLLVEKFPVDGPVADFWVRTYGPMVRALRQGDNLTAFTYLILQSADDKKAAQWVKSNKSKVETMLREVLPPLVELRASQPVVGAPAGQRLPGWYEKGVLQGLGPATNEGGNFKATGEWISLDGQGYVDGRGRFNAAGKRVGEWKALRPDGTVEKIFTFNDQGEREGLTREYHRNGQPAFETMYKAGKVEGVLTVFNECGVRTGSRTFKGGDLEGPYSSYYNNGQLKMRAVTKADKVDGLEEGFYPDGTPEYTTLLVNGVKQGAFVSYYTDKTPERKGTYDKGELDGPYTEYHANGKVQEEGRYAHGKRSGTWRTYFANGKVSVEKSYDEAGELNGLYHDYDEAGHLYCDTEYAHGRTTRVKYFDQKGQVVLDQATKKGRVAVQLPDAEGQKNATGTFLDGQMVGEWKWFYPDGSLREVTHFDDKGTKTGVAEIYHRGGQLRRRLRYDATGEEDGYFEQYTQDGQPSATGYYLAGQRHGLWKDYYADGRVSEDYEYFKGEQNGPAHSCEPGGKLTQERMVEFGRLRRITTYDSTGQVLTLVELRPDTKEYTLRYPSGKPMYRTGLTCYDNSGAATWLRPDGSVESSIEQTDGRRQGLSKSTFADGKTNHEGNYRAGQTTGDWSSYYPSGQLRRKGRYLAGEEEGEWT